jgi:hypothetical protein
MITTLRTVVVSLALFVACTCTGCESPWPDGTTVVATASRPGMPIDAWSTAIGDALEVWQEEIGTDCPIRFTLVTPDQATAGTRSIELVAPNDWRHGYNVIGQWNSDGGIEVFGTSPDDAQDYTFGSLVHELGHALAGPEHSHGSDIMSPNGGELITFDRETIERVRAARGCP